MSRSPFLVNVADLRRPSAAPRDVLVEAAVEWAVELSRTRPQPPLVARLLLAPASGGLLVTGSVDVAVEHTCHRCLRATEDELRVEVAQLFTTPGVEGEADYELTGDELDLEPVVRDEVLLAMPLLPVCGEGCPGPAGERPAPEDEAARSPFAVLEHLFDDD